MVTMVTIMGGDLQPGCFADRLLTGLSQPQINPKKKKVYCSAEKGHHEQGTCIWETVRRMGNQSSSRGYKGYKDGLQPDD